MMGLTPIQAKALAAIRQLSRGGVSPSYRDLQHTLGLGSVSGVHRLVHGLKDRGAITIGGTGKRTIRVCEAGPDLQDLSMDELRSLAWRVGAEMRRRGQ